MSVKDTLEQRRTIYGNYGNALKTRSSIMVILKEHYKSVNGDDMPVEIETGFHDLVLKLVRAAGKPEYKDSFHDLSGYAILMENYHYQKELPLFDGNSKDNSDILNKCMYNGEEV